MAGVGCAVIASSGFLAGMKSAPQKVVTKTITKTMVNGKAVKEDVQTAEKDRYTTDVIAVVNADVGVTTDGEKINYASKLLSDAGDQYKIVGLEKAKQGITDGTYAAYVVIPSDFSQSVVSLNDKPMKANIEYKLNSNLSDSSRDHAIYGVLGLNQKLNDDISYMYIDSILSEFHEAQDDATTIMRNDEKDAEQLASIRPDDLVESITIPAPKNATLSASSLDIGASQTALSGGQSAIMNAISEANSRSSEQLSAIKENGKKLSKEMNDDFDKLFSSIPDEITGTISVATSETIQKYNQALDEYESQFLTNCSEVKSLTTVEDVLYSSKKALEQTRDYNKTLESRKAGTVNAICDLVKTQTGKNAGASGAETQTGSGGSVAITISAAGDNVLAVTVGDTTKNVELSFEEDVETDEDGTVTKTLRVDMGRLAENLQSILGNVPQVTTTQPSQASATSVNSDEVKQAAESIVKDYTYIAEDIEKIPVTEQEKKRDKNASLNKLLSNIDNEQSKVRQIINNTRRNEESIQRISANVDSVSGAGTEGTAGNGGDPFNTELKHVIPKLTNEDLVQEVERQFRNYKQEKIKQVRAISTSDEMKEYFENFNNGLNEFNPYENVTSVIPDQVQSMGTAIADLEKNVMERDMDLQKQVADINETNRSNLEELQKTLVTADENSRKSVSDGLASVQSAKKKTTEDNSKLLTDLQKKLPYTRLGNVEYTQSYKFITSPTTLVEIGETGSLTQTNTQLTLTENDEEQAKTKAEESAKTSVETRLEKGQGITLLLYLLMALALLFIVIILVQRYLDKRRAIQIS